MEIGSKQWKTLIESGAKELGISIQNDHVEKFALHALELMKWNKNVNLTAITDPFEVAIKHFVDSLLPAVEIKRGASLVDIGSGGGFPGIPIKILCPSVNVLLVESSRKKVNFLKHVIRITDLSGIDAIHARAEDLPADRGYKGHFDIAVCRAFSSLDHFADLAMPILKKEEGYMIAMKGKNKEASTFIHAGSKHKVDIQTKTFSLPFISSIRTIIKISFHS